MWRFLFLLFPTTALADCGDLFLRCTLDTGTKTLEVCSTDAHATYRFGPVDGPPDLSLRQPVTEVHMTPWPGIGSTVWEEVTFRNQGHSYVVYGNIQRDFPKDEDADIIITQSGGVIVLQGDTEIAHFRCDPGSIDFPWGEGLYRAKQAAGQCYERSTGLWRACR